jgi:hypothetical protein
MIIAPYFVFGNDPFIMQGNENGLSFEAALLSPPISTSSCYTFLVGIHIGRPIN